MGNGVGKSWSSGEDKTWYNGQRVLVLYVRTMRVLKLIEECRRLKISRMFLEHDLLKTYQKLTVGVESGRYQFRDASDGLKLIEVYCEKRNIENVFKRLKGAGVSVESGLVRLCVKCGFMNDVTERVLRSLERTGL